MYAPARTSPTGSTSTSFVNLERANFVVSEQAGTNWFAKVLLDSGDCYILSNAGYASKAACDTAIDTLLP